MAGLCEELRQFAIEVHQLGYSLPEGIGEAECLELSQRMLTAARQAETGMPTDATAGIPKVAIGSATPADASVRRP